MPLLANIRKCVAKRQNVQRRFTKVFFNVKIGDSFKSPNVPSQLRDLLVYIARDGVAVTDLFRRPGNPQDMKKIIAELEAGHMVNWREYNFYTLANIAKRYLLHIEGGILGRQAENYLIEMLESQDDQARIEAMHSVIVSQPKPVQQLLALLFGIWFRMIYHTEVNAMSVEAVAKSVAGSVFPSCTTSIQNVADLFTFSLAQVERASKVMEYLITGFASADLFSRELIEYFTTETKTSISRVEKFKYEFRFPKDVPREKSVRLFMRLLLEEGKKHGFHIINDAVSKETFESANWETWCSPRLSAKHSLQDMSSTLTTADSKEDIPDEDRPRHPVRSMNEPGANHRHPNVSRHSVQTNTTDGGALISTKTSTTLTPTLVRKSK
ncbi:Rho GTPase-activating protein 20, partial [Paragonimus westermani]